MDDRILSLLALLAEQAGKRAALAGELASGAKVDELVQTPSRRPGARAWGIAARQSLALELLGITTLVGLELPLSLTRARPLPPALFVRGDRSLLSRPAVGIVGARRASPGPLAWVAAVARALAAARWLVVSGGARGIDAAAHRAAVAAGAPTVAYLGVPADRIYPECNRRLFEQILARGGALVSEHPPLSATFGASHAARNRLIAAQASHVIVAEAAVTSGSLGTAAHARRRGVPIWVPPPETGGERAGIDALLASGAARVLLDTSELGLPPDESLAPQSASEPERTPGFTRATPAGRQ